MNAGMLITRISGKLNGSKQQKGVVMDSNDLREMRTHQAEIEEVDVVSAYPPELTKMYTRMKALELAREYVRALYNEKNDRGYPKWAATPDAILAHELKVAKHILGEDE
jgi:hypothetical protein